MCGLFGALGEIDGVVDKALVKQLGVLSVLRGDHSTGLITVKEKKKNRFKYSWMKDATNAVTFLKNANTQKMLSTGKTKAIVGHCRYATIGEKDKKNAHPFVTGNLIGVHNGTINKFKHQAKFEGCTDSELFFKSINKNGLDESIHSLYSNDAFAVVYADTKDNRIYFSRNDLRTLYYVMTKDKKKLFWASEARMLEFMMSSTHQEFNEILSFAKDRLYWYDLNDGKLKVRDLKEKERFRPSITGMPGQGGGTTKATPPFLLKPTKEERELYGTNENESKDNSHFHYKGYEGIFIPKNEAIRRLNTGCAGCGSYCTPEDEAYFYEKDVYLCQECENTGAACIREWTSNRQPHLSVLLNS